MAQVPCAPRVVHTLTDYLPPQSLLEVQKKEVCLASNALNMYLGLSFSLLFTQVVDSYLQPVLTRYRHVPLSFSLSLCSMFCILCSVCLHRILKHQEILNSARRFTRLERAKVKHYLQLEREALQKRSERERLITRLKLYKAQLKQMEEPEKEGKSFQHNTLCD